MSVLQDVERVARNAEQLFSQAEIETAARELAHTIAGQTKGQDLLVLCLMNGGLIATAMLLPHLPNLLRVDYVHASRYRDEMYGRNLNWYAKPHVALEGQHVLVVDDIYDEGHTLKAVCDYCEAGGAATVRSAVLVNKLHERKPSSFAPSFVGLQVPDRFVFGCGMDYKGYLRNMPGIFALAD